MMGKIEKMIEKKKKDGKGIDGLEKEAALNNLMDLKGAVEGMIGDKAKGLKKVTVASNSEKGLEQGLELAKEKLGEMDTEDEIGDEEDTENMPDLEQEVSSDKSEMSEDEIEAKIKELLAMKEKMKK
jgi:ribonuclease HI